MKLETYESKGQIVSAGRATPSGNIAQRQQKIVEAQTKESTAKFLKAVDDIEKMYDLSRMTKANSLASENLNKIYMDAENDGSFDSMQSWNAKGDAELQKIAASLPAHLQQEFMAKNTPYLTGRKMQLANYKNDLMRKDLQVEFDNANSKDKIAYAQGNATSLASMVSRFSEFQIAMGLPEKSVKVALEKEVEGFKLARIDYDTQTGDADAVKAALDANAYGLKDKTVIPKLKNNVMIEQGKRKAQQDFNEWQGQYNAQVELSADIVKDPTKYTSKQFQDMADAGTVTDKWAKRQASISKKKYLNGNTDKDMVADWLYSYYGKEAIKNYNSMNEEKRRIFLNNFMDKGLELVDNGVMPLATYNQLNGVTMGTRFDFASKSHPGERFSNSTEDMYSTEKSLLYELMVGLTDQGPQGAGQAMADRTFGASIKKVNQIAKQISTNWQQRNNPKLYMARQMGQDDKIDSGISSRWFSINRKNK